MSSKESDEDSEERDEDEGWTTKNCCRKTVAFLFSHIGLTALVVGYSIMGAFLFRHLESQHEMDKMGVITEWKNNTVEDIWKITNDVQLQELFRNNCTSTCSVMHNDTRVQLQKDIREHNALRIQQAKDELVATLWNLTMDLNVLWKENWTHVADQEINNLIKNVHLWTGDAELHPHKPEVKCTTICIPSVTIKNQTRTNWTDLVTEKIESFQINISDAAQQGFEAGGSHPKWTFSSSFLYALSVITTIGYGHVTPKTTEGKVVTVLYAVVGIPIMLMFLANVGNLLAKIFIGLFTYVCRCRFLNTATDPVLLRHRRLNSSKHRRTPMNHRSVQVTTTSQKFFPPDHPEVAQMPMDSNALPAWAPEVDELLDRLEKRDNNVPVIGCLVIMSVYLFGGATLFALWEGWPYLDAFYFCFVTLTTIGFGDFVPGASMLSDDTSNQKLVMCCIYVLVGLALIACCFNLMQHQVRNYVQALARVLGIIRAKTLGRARGKQTTAGHLMQQGKMIPTVTLNDV